MSAEPGERCITCGDEGIPMRVEQPGETVAGCRDADAALHQVAVDLVAPVDVGDELLVHAGVAIRNLGEAA
ncbi:MAG: HypC/HybG/HupF family hydrogenase formation chaperone [Solirubrobacteraceae bacterium]